MHETSQQRTEPWMVASGWQRNRLNRYWKIQWWSLRKGCTDGRNEPWTGTFLLDGTNGTQTSQSSGNSTISTVSFRYLCNWYQLKRLFYNWNHLNWNSTQMRCHELPKQFLNRFQINFQIVILIQISRKRCSRKITFITNGNKVRNWNNNMNIITTRMYSVESPSPALGDKSKRLDSGMTLTLKWPWP